MKIFNKNEKKTYSAIFAGKSGFMVRNSVTILFVITGILGIYYSQLPAMFIANELINRITRNMLLIMSLIIPIRAGMGLNFSIVIGAMAAQIAILFVINWGIGGISGFLLSALLMTPLAIAFGYLIGKIMNRCKGNEMIAGMMLAFFADGLYQLLFLFLMGTVIPINNSTLILSNGIGIKNSIDLSEGIKYALDSILKIQLPFVLIGIGVIGLIYVSMKIIQYNRRQERLGKINSGNISLFIFSLCITAAGIYMNFYWPTMQLIGVPIVTCVVLVAFYAGNEWILKTKMGQDFRAIGQSMKIAKTAGIDVAHTRIMAMVISTLLAAYGQLIFLQNIGTINTYGSHTQVGLFSCAAILIGGATLSKANGKQALLGLILFHTLFIVAPIAGKNLFGEPQIGEFFRVFIAYGVIGISLAVYAWQKNVSRKMEI